MWTTHSEILAGQKGLRFTIDLDSRPATFAEVIRAWQQDPEFRSTFNSHLAGVAYTAFRWETPAVTSATIARPFECVVLDAPGLVRAPDRNAFAEHFSEKTDVVVFQNLGTDAILIVPCPVADPSIYGHLAGFVRHAPEAQRDSLWQAVGEAMSQRVSDKPVWLNTAGAGVSWLHMRLDDRPKYYGFTPYRSP